MTGPSKRLRMQAGSVFLALVLFSPALLAADCVVLLHGLARTASSMETLGEALGEAGYRVVNHDYPSRDHAIPLLAEKEIPKSLTRCGAAPKVHFVTHSLGGILVRHYMERHALPNLGRVVMLGPPNKGSQVVDRMKNVPGFKLINGEAGMTLGTDAGSIPNSLGPVDFELGVIAGTDSINLILSTMLPNPDDGKVSVENTKVAGMADHMTVPVSHPFLMKDEAVINQVLAFLKTGQFSTQ